MITRRGFLKGLVASTVLAIPSVSLLIKPDWYEVEESFFANQSWKTPDRNDGAFFSNRPNGTSFNNHMIFSLRTQYIRNENFDTLHNVGATTSPGQLNSSILNDIVGPDGKNCTPVKSLGHAEYHFLHNVCKNAPSRDIYDPTVIEDIKLTEGRYLHGGKRLGPMIVRMGNKIAQKTRRGAGNVLVYHPSNEDLIKGGTLGSFSRPVNMRMHPTKNCPKDKLVCLYKGFSEVDSGFIFAGGKDGGEHYLWEMPEHEKSLNVGLDYVQVLPLQNI
jgi:hypothetical protein